MNMTLFWFLQGTGTGWSMYDIHKGDVAYMICISLDSPINRYVVCVDLGNLSMYYVTKPYVEDKRIC